MNLSRRHFLEHVALVSGGLTASRLLGPFAGQLLAQTGAAGAGNPLRLPPVFSGGELVAEATTINIWNDAPTTVWTLGGSFPGPTIIVRRGDTLDLRFVNRLSESSNIHWHGLLVPAAMDGHPANVVQPDGSMQITFQVDQSAGTYWYHPHPHGLTARQAYLGMAGLFIVRDDVEDALGLPSGEYDVPLAIQDRRIGAGRTISYNPTMADEMTGMLGDTMLVNGTPEPYLEVSRDIYRFRLLNGSNARIMKVGFADGMAFHLIGGDGGLLDKPYEVTSFWLGPGGRGEILVDFSAKAVGNSLVLRTLPYDGAPDPLMQGWGMDIIRFNITRDAQQSYSIPTDLRPLDLLDPSESVGSRTFVLGMSHGQGEMLHTINGKAYDMERIDERVAAGSVEIWEFINTGDEPHPMHFHGAQFQMISRDGEPADRPEDRGWKDIVVVDMLSSIKVAVRFGLDTGTFLMHCHNLEHEDTGMMINYAVEQTSGIDEVSDAATMDLVHPNPARDVVTIPIIVAHAATITVRCYSSDGRLVRSVVTGEYQVGRHEVRLDVRSLAQGTYRLELEAGEVRRSQWVVVVR